MARTSVGSTDLDELPSTGANMSLLAMEVEGVKVNPGDALTAYSLEGLMVGRGVFDVDSRCGLAVWGDDPATPEREGLLEGEAFTLGLAAGERVDILNLVDVMEGKGLVYETNDFTVLKLRASDAIPREYYLAGSYPNPFNSAARIEFGMPEAGRVSLKIFDLQGRLVESLWNGVKPAGRHSVIWQGENRAAGLYIIRMEAGDFSSVRKTALVK